MTVDGIYYLSGGWRDPSYRISDLNVKWRAITAIMYNGRHPENVLSIMVAGMSSLCS